MDEPDAPIETSLDQILAHIRTHWEKVMERNRAETDSYLECKVKTAGQGHLKECVFPQECLTCVSDLCVLQEAPCVGSKLNPEEEKVETLKAECTDVGCKIQSLQAENESIRALVR